MRLFTKTLLSFAAVILFESLFTALFATNTIEATNRNDARRELESEARATYDNFNAWKRRIWKDLIALSKDERVLSAASLDNRSERATRISRYLERSFFRTGYDVVFLSILPEGYTNIIPIGYNTFSLSDLQSLRSERGQPYVEVGTIGHIMAIIGVLRIPAGSGGSVEVFIVKRVDRQFCESIASSRNAFCSFYVDGSPFDGGGAEAASGTLPVALSPQDSYGEAYRQSAASGWYNIAVQRVPNVAASLQGRSVVMATFVSNLRYENRLRSVREIVILVSAATAVLMLLLSLVLTSNITVPVRRLLGAMRRFQHGEYVAASPEGSSVEISELLSGFNEMAAKLHQDRLSMDRYLKEITFLNEYNERVIESIRSGIVVLNEAGLVQKANAAFAAMVAKRPEEVYDRSLELLEPELFGGIVAEGIEDIRQGRTELRGSVRRTRGRHVFEIKLYPLHPESISGPCILVIDDVSRKMELEEKIFQAEKLSSLSMLSAGVAHEINNPLSSIMTHVQNLIFDEQDQEKQVSLKWIEQETRRIAGTVNQLLRFAAPDVDPGAGCDVNEVVAEALALVGYSLRHVSGVTIRQELTASLPAANIGVNELKQVLINLVMNALQALEGTGNVTVRTAARRDGRIAVSVTDTGKGIDAEVLPHVFDPFFTTKRNGEGTGLGLSIVYGILKKYRADIRISTRPGRGTRMTVSLMAAREGSVAGGRRPHGTERQ